MKKLLEQDAVTVHGECLKDNQTVNQVLSLSYVCMYMQTQYIYIY